ncbi:unnamed protein product [Mytilus edulis]|uniref:DUF6589 domain-containing protein n=1 Tax=Mytilus edulis TaxID=6550 RepID=A0A8S3R7N1_MYTED|nr:unnamed protein product [Mytilus edulis]
MVLLNLQEFCNEWPHVAQVVEIQEANSTCTIHWYKGANSNNWKPCSKPVRGKKGRKREPWILLQLFMEIILTDLDTPDRTSEEVFTESPYTTVMATETDEISSFQIVMDNLNMMTKVRHKTEDTSNKMHNLVHALAVQDRVSADDLEECVPQADILTIPNEAFLPSKVDYTQLNQEYNILIQRVLVENIIELKECKEFVIYHIPHQFSKESRKKSCVIPLGILEKDENKTEEMIEIIEHLHQYTPKAHDKMMPLLMGGDGLSVERGEGAQKARADGISQEDRLEGFIWKSEDWHAHVISLQDTFNQLFKGTSSPEKGTLFQLRNLFEHRGVKSEVKDVVNSCRDFLRFVTQGYVILAALNVLNMHSVNDIEESLSTKTKGEKKTFMENLSKNMVSKFLQTETPSLKQKGHGNKINKENLKLPIEDGQNYRLQKITEIEKTLINERDKRKSLYKKYKRGVNVTDGVDTSLISTSVVLAGIGIAFPILLPIQIAAVVCGSLGGLVKLIRRKLTTKSKKHYEIKTMAECKLNSIKDLISKSLTDGQISADEFKLILDELEKFNEMKKKKK